MSWDDWSPDVRMAAAQALGTTGHAKVSANLTQLCHLTVHLVLSFILCSYCHSWFMMN